MYITQSLKRAMQVNGNGIATIDGERRQTWNEFGERVAKLAGAFKNLGLGSDGRVAILSLNSDRYLECFYATHWADGISVPLNIRLAPPELIYMLNDAGVEILLVDDTFQAMLPIFEGKLETVKHVVFAGDGATPAGTINYEEILAAADPVPDSLRGGEQVSGICYTGGTTGVPKGVMLTHTNLIFNALNFLTFVYKGGKWTYLHTAPMFHAADAVSHISVTMMAATHAFIPKFDPIETMQAIADLQITHSIMVPTMINMMVNHPKLPDYDLSSLKSILYGGSPMPEAVQRRTRGVIPDCELVQAYGMTELSPISTLLEDQYHTFEGPNAGKIKSGGIPVFSVEVKIVDVDRNEVPRGVIGEILNRGPHVMKGYWNKPKETAEAIRDGWMHTGDAGYMDEDGFVFIADRVKDMIVTGGENVYSIEVENAIYQHPAVAMCAVIGVPSQEWGEAIHAIIQPKAGESVTQEEIFTHCKTLIANYKCPRSVEVSQEPLPISGAGKILKGELRKPFWAGQERQVA